ncbi:MAG: hypothetical protein LUE27_06625 [Clostridia bacterium]|nr:hypothetical protein [Clostridia bacterium]
MRKLSEKSKRFRRRFHKVPDEIRKKREKPFEKKIFNPYQNLIVIPEGYDIAEMMDLDDEIMADARPYYTKEVHVIFE